ncbi:serine-protein kinase ATM [Trichonephila clavata]|uniref:non-specific serine/threonine protein kinase n=1 Tax=Trichonephila clavata TaxID=2740835 RepID=A0A8X6FEJ8_TRICU|nr:serine-protein kinase ATM [Trichonephila clavata]
MEPSISWPVLQGKSNCEESDVFDNAVVYTFAQFLNSPFVAVHFFVANNIHSVISFHRLDSTFDHACAEIFNFLQNDECLDLDTCMNKVSTFFHFMSHVILQFPCFQSEVLFMMCKIVQTKKIDQSFITKVFAQLSTYLGFSSTKNFIELHFPYIFHEWMKMKFSLEDFPFMILDAESLDAFIVEFFKDLIPVLFLLEELPSISKIAEKLQISNSELIYSCLPTIQAQIISGFAVKTYQIDSDKAKGILDSMIPAEISEAAFLSKLDEFIICLLKMLKDDQSCHLSRCQIKNANSITSKEFLTTITFIMSSFEYKGSFISFLNKKGDCIQNIFLALSVILSKALRPHEGRHVLFMYKTFLELLCSELGPGLNCSCFVIKEVTYTIINFLTSVKIDTTEDETIVIYCCDILQLVCSNAVSYFKEIIGEFLPFIVSSLISFAQESERGKKVLLSFLTFLIIDCEASLADYIPFLDPFPENTIFQNLACKYNQIKYKSGKLSLKEEIILFLKSYKMMGKATITGLQHLCNHLKSRQKELLEILNSLKGSILFSEDVKTSVHHQLVCVLASICTQDNVSLQIQEAASSCMAAIGPVAFSSVVLQPSSNVTSEGLNPIQQGYAEILYLLTEYLFDKRIDIKVTTSEIMKELFGTKTGYSFFIDYQTLRPNNSVKKYASPFFACQNVKDLKSKFQDKYKIEDIKELSLWLPENTSHSDWITNLVCTIIGSGLAKNNFYECLIPICKKEVQFCEKILPYIIHAILLLDDKQTQNAISVGIDTFFSRFSLWIQEIQFKNEHASSSLPRIMFSKASVKTMLSVIHHIWLNPKQESKSERNILKDFWLNISFLEVAQAAQYCSAYFTAILFTELWCDKMREKSLRSEPASDHSDSSGSLDCSPLSYIGSHERDKAALVYDIIIDTYSQIGDSDAISGCEVVATDTQAILKHSYLIDKKWNGLLKISDLNHSNLEILQALQQNHLNFVLQGFLKSLMCNEKEISPNMREYQCEAAWRMGQWDLSTVGNCDPGFQECVFKSTQNVISENSTMFEKMFVLAKKTQYEYLRHTSLEAARNIFPVLCHIQMLSVIEDFSKIQANPNVIEEVLKAWDLQDQMPYEDFEFVEPVSWLKCILLKHQINANSNKQWQARTTVLAELKKLLERYAVQARNELHLEVASNAIHVLRQLPNTEEEDILCWQMEEAKILWTKKEYSVANKILKSTLPYMEKFAKENPKFLMKYGQALTLRGRWLAETCNENSIVIMRDFLEKALDVFQNINLDNDQDCISAICDAYLAVARYADGQYQSIINYKKSTAYQAKLDLISSSREQAKQLQQNKTVITEDQRKLHLILTRQSDIDQKEMKCVEADRTQFLEKAVINYLQCLRSSNTHDLWIFRLVSLWFKNLDVEEINVIIKEKISELQTYKFLPLMYQLAARMGSQASSTFTFTLTMLIRNISVDHPHHSLPVILALNNADKDPVDKKEVTDQTVHLQQAEVPAVKERMNAAKKLLSILLKTKINHLVKSYSDLCDAYISLAYLSVPKNLKKGIIPKDQPLLKFKNLQNIPVISEEIKVDKTCEYKNIIGIHSFHNEFRMCGGITLPKVIKCIGVDGSEREQLVKGSDDLRQDAVMQQVFCLVNCLLKQRMETKNRKLHIRTYKVVPVSRRSGVLQWCEGTQVLSQYLGPAHLRYYPSMNSPQDCRKKMMSIASVSQLPKKRQIYDSICADFPPVFRYFFLENFPEPSAWFERRQSYIKSVAASSIVGYIMGLGDRHVNNILIDKNTAEVVHIDFGIAFEKGKILATPETVPFRLTRDVVDGMGINGVEGTFKRCCEKTLEVMRNSQDVLLTILEVLLHDPLYEWSIPAATQKNNNISSNSQNEVNTLAERALMRLQQKLQGLEEGVAMSTEGQVNLLIQQARDPNNLCRIYAGWQPYL